MSTQKKVGAYRTTDLNTASRERLLLLMYEGAIRFLKQAIEAGAAGDFKQKLHFIDRSRKIIKELQRTLDFERGGEIAVHLDRLYIFVNDRLLKGTLDKTGTSLDEALQVLETLYSGWQEAVSKARAESKDASR